MIFPPLRNFYFYWLQSAGGGEDRSHYWGIIELIHYRLTATAHPGRSQLTLRPLALKNNPTLGIETELEVYFFPNHCGYISYIKRMELFLWIIFRPWAVPNLHITMQFYTTTDCRCILMEFCSTTDYGLYVYSRLVALLSPPTVQAWQSNHQSDIDHHLSIVGCCPFQPDQRRWVEISWTSPDPTDFWDWYSWWFW